MRAPTTSEKRLLAILLGAVFLALNLGAIRIWMNFSQAQDTALTRAQTEISDGQGWIVAAEALGEVVQDIPPLPSTSRSQASTGLLNTIRQAASAGSLTIERESLPPPPTNLPEEAVSARVKLKGPFSGLVRFLYELQAPTAWRSIENLTIKADNEPQNVLAEMEIRQYYSTLAETQPTEESASTSPQ